MWNVMAITFSLLFFMMPCQAACIMGDDHYTSRSYQYTDGGSVPEYTDDVHRQAMDRLVNNHGTSVRDIHDQQTLTTIKRMITAYAETNQMITEDALWKMTAVGLFLEVCGFAILHTGVCCGNKVLIIVGAVDIVGSLVFMLCVHQSQWW
jgi:hypothetical protein